MPERLTRGDRFLLVAALTIFAYTVILAFGAAWGGCHDPNRQNNPEKNSYNDDCAVNGIGLRVVDLGDLVHRRRDDLTAISTTLIAIFTIVLALVTGRQARLTKLVADAGKEAADAAKLSADALPTLERAYVFIEIVPLSSGMQHTIQHFRDHDQITEPFRPEIQCQFINHGKTPAIVKRISAFFAHYSDLPREVRYIDEPISGEIVIQAGSVHPAPYQTPGIFRDRIGGMPEFSFFQKRVPLSTGPIDREAAQSLGEGKSFLWFYGHIVYNDIFGREHETRFCWWYNGFAHTFQQYDRGDERLNRRS
jgi:hypothetical protein